MVSPEAPLGYDEPLTENPHEEGGLPHAPQKGPAEASASAFPASDVVGLW